MIMSFNKDDIRLVITAPDGSWLSASVGGRNMVGEELRDFQKTIEGRGGPNQNMPFGVAQNPPQLPPPSAEKGAEQTWLPMPVPRRRRKKKK